MFWTAIDIVQSLLSDIFLHFEVDLDTDRYGRTALT